MKKIALALVALFAMGSVLVSCSKSNEDLIKELESTSKEAIEAFKSGDAKKAQELDEKAGEIAKELEGRDLTDAEKAQIQKIFMAGQEALRK